MTLDIPCPYCELVIQVPDDYLGGGVRCPRCTMVIPVQQTGVTADEPPGAPVDPWGDVSDKIKLPKRTLPRSARYQPGRGKLVLGLGLASLGVSVLGIIAGAFLCGTQLLFGPPAFGLGLAAWVMGQRDMEKIRRAIIDPDADKLTRGGWVAGIVGTIFAVLMTVCGACGAFLQFVPEGRGR
jgi:hypothetical protein